MAEEEAVTAASTFLSPQEKAAITSEKAVIHTRMVLFVQFENLSLSYPMGIEVFELLGSMVGELEAPGETPAEKAFLAAYAPQLATLRGAATVGLSDAVFVAGLKAAWASIDSVLPLRPAPCFLDG